MTLHVCIKGSREAATTAMRARKIPFTFDHCHPGPYLETYGWVPDRFEEAVREAFHAHDAVRDARRVMPAGAILLWSRVSNLGAMR